MKHIIYCRKSSEDAHRQILSIESQEKELLSLVEKQNQSISKIFRESMSAKEPGRPEFEKMIKLIKQYPGSIIFVWKLDRLARNPVDEGQIKWLLQNKTISQIITPDRIYYPEDNALIASVEFGMANQYIRDLSANVKRGNRIKLEKGGLPGRAPTGYLNNRLTRQIDIDPIKAPLIKQAFELYATGGYSLRDTSKILFAQGLKTNTGLRQSRAFMKNILSNHFYYGVIVRDGQFYQGIHQSLVSKVLFDQVQTILSGKTRPRSQKHFFPLRGYMNCASCGCLLTVTAKKGHVYYYCTNGKGNCEQHKKYLNEKLADELVAKVFQEIKFDTEAIEIAYLAAKEKTLQQGNNSQTQKDILAKQFKTEQDKLVNLSGILWLVTHIWLAPWRAR